MSIVYTPHGTINVPETIIALEKRIAALEAPPTEDAAEPEAKSPKKKGH